jgi:hypothetical protein
MPKNNANMYIAKAKGLPLDSVELADVLRQAPKIVIDLSYILHRIHHRQPELGVDAFMIDLEANVHDLAERYVRLLKAEILKPIKKEDDVEDIWEHVVTNGVVVEHQKKKHLEKAGPLKDAGRPEA